MGSAFFAIPGFGPVLVAGPLVAWILAGLEGAVVFGGMGAIGVGLFRIGVPKDSIVEYEAAIKSDKFLLLAHGSAFDVENAKETMNNSKALQVAVHVVQEQEALAAP